MADGGRADVDTQWKVGGWGGQNRSRWGNKCGCLLLHSICFHICCEEQRDRSLPPAALCACFTLAPVWISHPRVPLPNFRLFPPGRGPGGNEADPLGRSAGVGRALPSMRVLKPCRAGDVSLFPTPPPALPLCKPLDARKKWAGC